MNRIVTLSLRGEATMSSTHTLGRRSWASLSVCAALMGGASCPAPARALTPKSPEVKEAVERACAFLASHEEHRPGGKALVGLTFIKAGKLDHPRVKEGIAAVNQMMKFDLNSHNVYTIGLTLIFLTELPPPQQAEQADTIRRLIAHLKAVQKSHGGWGYAALQTGDTSMHQYGILAMWSAEAAGYDTPLECWEKAANWVIRTQAPNGSYTYQGQDPGGFTPIEQDKGGTRPSICAAGSGCLYMCADYFGLLDEKLGSNAGVGDGDSPLKKVKKPGTGRKGKESTQVDPQMLWGRISKADEYMNANYTLYPAVHPCYYLYAFERYKTFKDYCECNIDKEVAWYTEMAQNLFKMQKADGHWDPWHHENGEVCDTCFAALFLLRSMYKKVTEIKRLQGGLAVGGRGLPSGDGDLEMKGGSVKHKPLKGPFEDLLAKMANPNDPDFERAMSGAEQQSLAGIDDHLSDIQKKLRDMFKNSKSPEQRVAAIKFLARTRDLHQVPVLLEALKDPAPDVFMAANEGLRFISRKFGGPGFWGGSDEPTRREAQKFWNKWYKSLNPEGELEE